MFSFKPYFISKGWLGAEYARGAGGAVNSGDPSNGGTSSLRQGGFGD